MRTLEALEANAGEALTRATEAERVKDMSAFCVVTHVEGYVTESSVFETFSVEGGVVLESLLVIYKSR